MWFLKKFNVKTMNRSYIKYCIIAFLVMWLWIMYILGGCKAISGFWHGGIGNRIGLSSLGALIALVLIYVVGRMLDWSVPDFSWREYYEGFSYRYHVNKTDMIVVISAMLVGGCLRLVGYDWGITSIFQPDEGKLVRPAIDMAMAKCPYQNNFYYPSQIFSKFAAVLIFIYGRCTGAEINYALPQAHFIFRIITAVVGTATIFVCFLIGNYFKKHLGAILAVLVSVYPLYTLMAKQVTGDVPVFFFLSLTMLFSLRYMEEKRNVFIVFMTMGAALATLEKWHGAVGIGYIGFIVLLNSKHIKEILSKGILAIGTYAVWIMALSPNMIFNMKSAIVDGFINIAVYDGSEGEPYLQMLMNYERFGIDGCGGTVYLCLIIIGLVYVIKHFTKEYLICLMGILKILILCLLNRQFSRWGFELFFCQIFLAAMGMWLVLDNMRMWKCRIVGYAVLALITIEFMSGSMVYAAYAIYSENDTRLIQEKECLTAGITENNSVSCYFTGFSPGGINSRMGMKLYQELSDFFQIQDGRLYKKKNIDYAILNFSWNREQELTEVIRKEGVLLLSYDAKYRDLIGGVNGENSQVYLNDLRLIWQNMRGIYDLCAGVLSGCDIEVYNVSSIPLKFD